MKYGLELSRRSVPEWKPHNIDYNEIKHLIKRATLPNSSPEAVDDLVNLLFEEFESVNLFVKSKSGEIERRIDDCEKIVDAIALKEEQLNQSSRNYRGPSQAKQAKIYRLHRDINTLSHDIQSLSRFISAQRTGFRKLLKKYRKWSNTQNLNALSVRFLPALESPESFINHDFTSSFLELSLLYDIVRSEKFTQIRHQAADQHNNPDHEGNNSGSTAQSLCKFDCTMITSVTQSATFWVHQDNLVELKIALLKDLALYSTTTGDSNQQQQQAEETSVVYLDDKKFHSIQNATDPGQVRWVNQNTGVVLLSPTGGLRHFTSMNLTQQQVDAVLSGSVHTDKLHLNNTGKLALGWVEKRNAVPVSKVTTERTRYVSFPETDDDQNDQSNKNSTSSVVSNLDHPYVWAVLDNNIRLTRDNCKNTRPCSSRGEDDGDELFPHAVLEIRWKGMEQCPDWITKLGKSHLVKKVPGFSLFSYTVANFHSDALQELPSWYSLIKDNVDIRKTPKTKKRRSSNQNQGAGGAYIKGTSSATTTPGGGNGPTSILLNDNNNINQQQQDYFGSSPNNSSSAPALEDANGSSDNISISSAQMMRLSAAPSTDTQLQRHQQQRPVVRYWNEFDDPEEGADNGHGIFVIASEEENQIKLNDGLFSKDNVDSLVKISDKFVKGISKRLGLQSPGSDKRRRRKNIPEYERLIETEDGTIIRAIDDNDDDDDYGDDDDDDSQSRSSVYSPKPRRKNGNHRQLQNGYNTFGDSDLEAQSFYIQVSERRDGVLTFLYSGCFFIGALTICILFGVIAGEDMNAITYGTFAFIVSGLLFALGVGVLAMCLFMLRELVPTWWHQIVVFTVFFSIVCFGVGGIAWMLA